MELLARLLNGTERVKIMRFFLHHDDGTISLASIGFIEKKRTKTVVTTGAGKKAVSKIKEVNGYKLNPLFPHNKALKELLFDFQAIDKRELASRFKIIGRLKLFIVAGVFIGDPKSRVDVLIVGESINRQKAEKIFEQLAAELGREVIYSIMDVEEYEYRFKMYDKFVRDIMEMEHETVVDKLKGR